MCVPCKIILNEETGNCAAAANRLREMIATNLSGEAQDDLLYDLAAVEHAFIKGVRGVAAKFSVAIDAPLRWQSLLHDLAGEPQRATPGAPAEED